MRVSSLADYAKDIDAAKELHIPEQTLQLLSAKDSECPPSAHAPPRVTPMLLHPRPALLQMQLQLLCLRLQDAIDSNSSAL